MHVTHVCPRFKEIHGGGEPVLLNLFKELCDLGIKNTVCTYILPQSMFDLMDQRVELKGLPPIFERKFTNVLIAGLFDLLCSSFLALYCINKKTDIICFHTENTVPALFLYKVLQGKKSTLYFCFQPPRFAYDTSRETAAAGGGFLGSLVPLFKAVYRPFDRIAVRFADKVTTFSNDYKKWIEDIYGINDVAVLPPGVRLPEYTQGVASGEIPGDLISKKSRVLISVGKLVTWKKLDRLIYITARIQKKMPNVYLLIVGNGPCYDSLKQQVNDLSLTKNIIFCGYVSIEKVFSYCSISDLLMLLEQNASFGLSLIEANASGIPVMAFEGGGPSDIIENGKNGFLLPQKATDKEITEMILEYFADQKKIDQMRKDAEKIAEKYTWENFAQMFINVAKKTSLMHTESFND